MEPRFEALGTPAHLTTLCIAEKLRVEEAEDLPGPRAKGSASARDARQARGDHVSATLWTFGAAPHSIQIHEPLSAMWALKAARRLPKSLQVEWEDGFLAKFPYVWLRDNTFRRPSLVHLDLDLTPQVVDYSTDRLSVLWPPCIASQYSSQFLRSHSIVKPPVDVEEPSPQTTLPNAWKIVPAGPVDPLLMMGTVEWGDRAKDLGTMWPHLERVPSLCTVDSLSGVARVYVVDAVHAFEEMAVRRPEEFAFLQRCTVEYREGPFTARHRIVTMNEGRVAAALFNNESRSAEITVESVDEFYACLKSFGRIAWENAHTVEIGPRERLVVDNHRVLVGAPAQFGRRLFVRTFS
ncbi:hypothetical protein QR680_009034 [Steinernema hermaphroditum]|uniref:Uncharacterized protein n=1 Tax=Steinernema hermaphroditum TaxID=289476 RepID=A0AA39IIS1_9BILA|nr:hypothetical protein QR680_009034 [Steinernema hermaphroditum]